MLLGEQPQYSITGTSWQCYNRRHKGHVIKNVMLVQTQSLVTMMSRLVGV